MNKLSCCIILVLMFSGCAGLTLENSKDRFVNDRNYDVGRNVEWSYATHSKIIPYNEAQDKYVYEWDKECKGIGAGLVYPLIALKGAWDLACGKGF